MAGFYSAVDIRELSPDVLRFAHATVQLRQGDGGVAVTCEGEGGAARFEGDYLLATEDGAHRLASVAVDNIHTPHRFLVVECEADLERRFVGISPSALLLGEQSLVSIIRLGSRVRIAFQLFSGVGGATDGDVVPDDLMKSLLGDEGAYRFMSAREMRIRHFLARSRRAGRVLLAGPAAHCFDSPLTHLGFNVDIHDAHRLVQAVRDASSAQDSIAVLEAHARRCHACGLRMMSTVLNSYYDVLANSAQALRFGKYEIRMSKLAAAETNARTFLMRQSLIGEACGTARNAGA